jgi:hypothetical protein
VSEAAAMQHQSKGNARTRMVHGAQWWLRVRGFYIEHGNMKPSTLTLALFLWAKIEVRGRSSGIVSYWNLVHMGD